MNTQQVVRLTTHPQPSLEYGTIESVDCDGNCTVQVSFGTIYAKKAAGCLMEPEHDDLVLVTVDTNGSCYILSVLKRSTPGQPSRLAMQGDCIIESRAGSIDLRADSSLNLSASDAVEVAADRINVYARCSEAVIHKVTLLGKALFSKFRDVMTVAKSMDQTMDRLTQRMENCQRFIEDHEEVQTGSTRYLVKDTLTTHAGNTMNISEELHTMHAEQIHMS